MTLGRMLGLPLIMVSMVLVAFILVGCFEPRMSVDCVRGTTVTCTFEERTWINHKGPTTLALDALGARVPPSMRRSDARQLDADRVTFVVPRGERVARHRVRGVLRYALCGAEDCIPRERWFSVTAR